MNNVGVMSIGLKAPMIRQGDDLVKIVTDVVLNSTMEKTDLGTTYDLNDKDVIGITESVVARAQGNYVTVDDIVQYLNGMFIASRKNLVLYSPIMSRNRFSLILKAFARYADAITIIYDGKYDEQGNPNEGINPFTGVDIKEYYREICEKESCKFDFKPNWNGSVSDSDVMYYIDGDKWHKVFGEFNKGEIFIDCRMHPQHTNNATTLEDLMCMPVVRADGTKSGYNNIWGLLGSNKADEETLKLFPRHVETINLVCDIQKSIKQATGKTVEVMVYGDGCFKDPVGGIWEWADPESTVAFTDGLTGTPNEIKIKYFADSKYKDLNGEELERAIDKEIQLHKNKNLVGSMISEGTTPRRYIDLLASLMDLTTGSGMRKTPIVLVKNYFD